MAEPEHTWEPLAPSEATRVLAPLLKRWWVVGGEAIDLFVGRKTRQHGDLDVAVLRSDVPAFAELRAQWDVHIAHDGSLSPWDGSPLADGAHQFWVRRPGSNAWSFEVLLEETDDDDWLFRRDHRVRRAANTIGRVSADGIPFLAPEICLLYKAGSTTFARNEADFDVAIQHLGEDARQWLTGALEISAPGHPWLRRLLEIS